MKKLFFLSVFLLFSIYTFAQSKPVLEQSSTSLSLEEITNSMQTLPIKSHVSSRGNVDFYPNTLSPLLHPSAFIGLTTQVTNHPISGRPAWIKLSGENINQGSIEEQCQEWFALMGDAWGLKKAENSFFLIKENTDPQGNRHLLWQQQQDGIPVYGNEIWAHFKNDQLFLINGRVLPSTTLDLSPEFTENEAIEITKTTIEKHTPIKALSAQEKSWLGEDIVQSKLVIFYVDDLLKEAHLAWFVSIYPNLGAHWEVMIDAHSGKVLRAFDHVCHILPPPGAQVTTATDLQGQPRTIHSYEQSGTSFLIDASRSMFNASNSSFPNDAQGVIWTINGNNTSPSDDNFNATHNTSSGNFWNDPLAVSAHYNAGEAFSYYKETFNRNSINGQGGNILSFINIVDEDGDDMDNAYWNGQAMFYGNGNTTFTSPLAKSLDVAGHEMTHGVIQSTANLEYQGESGALNESLADVFAVMIDRDDWKVGEGVVNTAIFSNNALRDLSNPHNGASQLGQAGWQPQHTNEQFTGSQDNGGVHINSGIPNRAFFLFATAIGKNKAEQVYYRALNFYLTRSSQFLDMRASVIQAAMDIYGQTEANAAAVAFTAVGIGSGSSGGSGGNTGNIISDLSVNSGQEFILFTEGERNNLYLRLPDGTTIADPLSDLNPLSKPSVTDDGSTIVFIASDRTMRAIIIDWSINEVTDVLTLSSSPIWRNVAISKDGLRVAGLTTDNDNKVLVFDFSQGNPIPSREYELFNPTFTDGVTTGNVSYADVLEFDHSGEYLMYDALNTIPTQGGTDIDYWDIGFMRIWNNTNDDFGNGLISKLFSALPENTSVGNPSFSKNSPFIIALDFIDNNDNTFFLLGSNIETGDVGTIRQNGELGYPNFSNFDDELIFNEEDNSGNKIIGTIGLQSDKITASGNAFVLLSNGLDGASWGTWFANGQRTLVDVEDLNAKDAWATVFPTVGDGQMTLEWNLEKANTFSINITDLLGRNIWQQAARSSAGFHRENLDVDLPSGVYLLRLEAGTQVFVQRFVVQ